MPQQPPMDSLEELLAVAKEAAFAGSSVLDGRGAHRVDAQQKSAEGDWVTAFDVSAERSIRAVISGSRPRDSISGEELGAATPLDGSGFRWSIDPLDGTTNFIRGIPYYSTSVAASGPDGEWLVGVVVAPALGTTYWASRGCGAWRNTGGRTERLTGPDAHRRGRILATGVSYEPAARREQLALLPELMPQYTDLRRLGSAALDLCMVAEGSLDSYIHAGLGEHDWAAGALIAEEAGAAVQRPGGGSGSDWTIASVPSLLPALRQTLSTR